MSIIPHHIAIIPDGNRRWAKEKGLPTLEGHRRGMDVGVKLGRKARQLGIKVLTFWAFSTENWDRSKEEVNYLMKLYEFMIDTLYKDAVKEQVHITHLGRKDRIPVFLKNKIVEVEEKTAHFDKFYSNIALDYGGRDEIIRALQRMKASGVDINEVNQEKFNHFLDTKDIPYPDVDLIIRTSGEQRTSGLMVWQANYAEYIFLPLHFPDFTPEILQQCIEQYSHRERRFGH